MIVVIGGANLDIKARSTQSRVTGTSNPGTVTRSAGGVGRNVAENLARLGEEVVLVTVVGDDAAGAEVLGTTRSAGVDVSRVRVGEVPTGTYVAALDTDGEMVIAVADMAATETLGALDVDAAAEVISAADLVVLDGNLSTAALGRALAVCADHETRVVLDPVSVPKAAAVLALLSPRTPVFVMTPNADELVALGGSVEKLHARGVVWVWTRLGPDGSRLSGPEGEVPIDTIVAESVVDVTGAGDAMLAAFCHALLGGATPTDAATYGQAAAALTVADPHTVRPDLTDELVRSLL